MATAPQTPPTVPDVATAPDPALPSQQFDPIAWAFTLSLSPFKQGMDQLAANVYDNATVAYSTSLTASTSASTATTAANTATQKAADATTAANTATQKLADMEALYDQFDDRYLGVKTTDPTVDNDGNALQAGALYINSVSGFIRVYTGSAWVQGISAVAGVTAINGQQGALVLPTFNGVPLLGNAGNIVTETQKVLYETRSSNTALAPADKGKLIDLTGGGWTQTLQAAATLGAGWYCYLRNLGGLTALPDTWNGTFTTDTIWTKGAGWTITGGQAVASIAGSASLTSTSSPIVIGRKYRVTYTVSNYSSGYVRMQVGGTDDTWRNANGTYTFVLVAASDALVVQGASSATLRIDNILIDEIDASVTLDPNGSELIDGITSGPIRDGMTLLVVCTGTAFECVRVGPHTAIEVKTSGVIWQPPLGVRTARVTLISGGVAGNNTGYAGISGSSFTAQINVTPSTTYTIAIGASAPYGSQPNQTTLQVNDMVLTSNTNNNTLGVLSTNGMTYVSDTKPVLGLWSGVNYGWSNPSSAASGAIIFEY